MHDPKTKVETFRLKLFVADFDARRRFYAEDLRWPIEYEWGGQRRGAMFETGAGTIELLEQKDAAWPVTSCDVSLRVADVWALWEEWRGKPNVVDGLRDNPWGDTSICIADPGGFRIVFFTATVKRK